ncbi:thiopeptide-type bacteriocin biosynthesis protein [Actinokineospora sp.]|uniref:thiopeptide-type bacteriocin biosynthesis protein n=1 Tax=Actinokineospora sp. TaxID=1872133 RepID=UPI0040384F63
MTTSTFDTEHTFTDTEHWRTLSITVPCDPSLIERLLLTAADSWLADALDAGDVEDWIMIRPPCDADGTATVKLQLRGAGPARVAELRSRITAFLGDTTGDPVVERAFRPEVDRFGGPHGMAVCMAHFVESTRIAVATIRATPSYADRLYAAAGLLLASVLAIGTGWASEIQWLRRYADSQAGIAGASPADVSRARGAAQATYLRDAVDWRHHHDDVRAAVAGSLGDLGAWHRLQSETWSTLARLHAAGRLTMPPAVVYFTLVQITHNQLGLRPQDNAYLAWLVSMTPVSSVVE